MLVVNRFQVNDQQRFRDEVTKALSVLAERPGFINGQCGSSADEPEYWILQTQWESIGAYRRALSAFDVKMYAMPLLSQALPEPSAFEVLLEATPERVEEHSSDRAAPPWGDDIDSSDDHGAARK